MRSKKQIERFKSNENLNKYGSHTNLQKLKVSL